MSGGFTLFVGGAETDLGLTDNDGRAAIGFDRFSQSRIALADVVGIVAADHAPVVSGETGGDIFGKGDTGGAFDTDGVVIVENDQIIQFQVTGERSRFTGGTFHHTAVAGDDEDLVGEEVSFIQAGAGGEIAVGDGHTDC